MIATSGPVDFIITRFNARIIVCKCSAISYNLSKIMDDVTAFEVKTSRALRAS